MSIPILAFDIGNTSTKCGWFPDASASVPHCEQMWSIPHTSAIDWSLWREMLWECDDPVTCVIASVKPTENDGWIDGLQLELQLRARVLSARGAVLPLPLAVEVPHKVGADRVANAAAANRLRAPQRPAIVIDSGTATTMEVVSETGQFIGGVIAPGLGLSAQALRDHTELLPLVECRNAPVAERVIGRNTEAAIHSGVWWGQVGAIREWISRTQLELQATADVFVTGGASSALAPYLGNQVRHVPELCLQGIAIWGSCSREINGVIE